MLASLSSPLHAAESPQRRVMRKVVGVIVTYLLPLVLVVLTTMFLLSGMGAIDRSRIMTDMASIDPFWIIASIITGLLAHVSRAIRWQYLLRPNGVAIRLGPAFNSVMIGYAANALVPRSGEVARPLVLAQRTGLAPETAIGSVVVERVLDVLSLLGALLLVMTYGQSELTTTLLRLQGSAPSTFAAADARSMLLSLVTLLAVLMALIVLVLFTRWGESIISMTLGRLHTRSADALVGILHRLRKGLDAVRQPRLLVHIGFHTILIWALYTVTTWLTLIAMPYGTLSQASLSGALLLLVILAVAVTIAPTPGAIGVYHVAGQVAVVSLFGATAYEGFIFAMASWIANQGVALAVGGIAWIVVMRSGVRVRLFSQSQHQEEDKS
ncbi:MAG: flippase-like domain-containing protein [Candidatus Kapabacteria bacterium]|nr:flippase-like domain-containing protein [Candidatus Kapabacteria bacterium]